MWPLRLVAGELCRGGQVHCGAAALVSHQFGVADALVWVLALFPSALLIEQIWIRRGRCRVCRRTHALLPDLMLTRRLDHFGGHRRRIALKVMASFGLRPTAKELGVPIRRFERGGNACSTPTFGTSSDRLGTISSSDSSNTGSD